MEDFVGSLEIPEDAYFVTARQRVREEIDAHPVNAELERLVAAIPMVPA
jgi:hypothetical protein